MRLNEDIFLCLRLTAVFNTLNGSKEYKKPLQKGEVPADFDRKTSDYFAVQKCRGHHSKCNNVMIIRYGVLSESNGTGLNPVTIGCHILSAALQLWQY